MTREARMERLEEIRETPTLLKRNAIIRDEKGFKGSWVAVPWEDFRHTRETLRALLDVAEAAESAVENFFGYGRIQTETLFVKMKRLRETLDALDADTEETP